MPARKRFYTQADLFALSITSGTSTTQIRFLSDEATAHSLGAAVSAEAHEYIRRYEVELPPADSRGYIVTFHLKHRTEPPPCYEVVEAAAKRHLQLEHIIFYGLQT